MDTQPIPKLVMMGLTRLGMFKMEETDVMRLVLLRWAGNVLIGIQPQLLILENLYALLFVGMDT